jgi:hypothetical protein
MKRGEQGSGRWSMVVLTIILVCAMNGLVGYELIAGIGLGFLLTIGLTK